MKLSNAQKAKLGILAREAWEAWEGRAEFLDANVELSASKCFEEWRRWEQHKKTGLYSLRDCGQEHYLTLKAHFQNLAGAGGAALKNQMRSAEEERIQAFWHLKKALAERDLAEAYAESICKTQYKIPLSEATEKQLWRLVYTIRSRRKATRKAAGPRYIQEDLGSLSEKPRKRKARPLAEAPEVYALAPVPEADPYDQEDPF